jgi:uncharacterized glyoxalase superfamily protein PhnB
LRDDVGSAKLQRPQTEVDQMARTVPDVIRALTPQLTIDGAEKAIDWYRKAFGAEFVTHEPDPGGKNAWQDVLKVSNSTWHVVLPEAGLDAHPPSLWLYAHDVDRLWQRAVAAGAEVLTPMADILGGGRIGILADPWGNRWSLAQHPKDGRTKEMRRRRGAFPPSAHN